LPSAADLLDLVAAEGPWLIFLMALLETSFVWGFFVPTGLALSVATAVTLDEGGSLAALAAAAVSGGMLGDSVGYWIGRAGHDRWSRDQSRVSHFVVAARAKTQSWFGGRPLLSITIPRVISFVRTVMPLVAGMSGISYPRFLTWEIPGVMIWCIGYMSVGMAAGQGFSWVARFFGPEAAIGFTALALGGIYLLRRHFIHPARDEDQ
jgi:membrane protein DedA with SNARE-associated domain